MSSKQKKTVLFNTSSLPPNLQGGCKHIFLDMGANRGNHARFLFEAAKYPGSIYLDTLDKYFGDAEYRSKPFDETGLCYFGIEPNPEWKSWHAELQSCYRRAGWRVIFLDRLLTNVDGSSELMFLDASNTSYDKWPARAFGPESKDPENENNKWVETISLPTILREIASQRIPGGKMLAKMDIEGAELDVLPHTDQELGWCQESTGIDAVTIEWHDRKFEEWQHKHDISQKYSQGLDKCGQPIQMVTLESEDYLNDKTSFPVVCNAEMPINDIKILHAPKIMIGHLSSASKYRSRRDAVRRECFPSYRAAGIEPHFFIGRPSEYTRHISGGQGQHATHMEIEHAKGLLEEAEEFNDIIMVPYRDHYRDLTDKTLMMFQYLLGHGGDYIAKVDDDECLNIEEVHELIASRANNPNELYAGIYEFNGNEYDSMKGPNGEVSHYFSGPAYVLSRGVVEKIVVENNVHSTLYSIYGTSSEDTNVGKWIDYAMQKDPGFKVDRVMKRSIARAIKVEQPQHTL